MMRGRKVAKFESKPNTCEVAIRHDITCKLGSVSIGKVGDGYNVTSTAYVQSGFLYLTSQEYRELKECIKHMDMAEDDLRKERAGV